MKSKVDNALMAKYFYEEFDFTRHMFINQFLNIVSSLDPKLSRGVDSTITKLLKSNYTWGDKWLTHP
jgi:hypothetical protein